MKIIIHNLKVAMRNLMKYKLQTAISIASIAIGIVTLALAHSVLNYYRLPAIYDQPYCERAYKVWLKTINERERQPVTEEILHAIKGNGGLRNAERITVYNGDDMGLIAEFHLPDSTVRKGQIGANLIDPEYPNYSGMLSAITGKEIKVLKPGEAIIGEDYAKTIFGDSNPIGAVQINTGKFQTMPVTIVDVYKTLSYQDNKRGNNRIYFCLTENIEDHMPERYFYAATLDVVLKEGSSEQKLLNEIDSRVKPFGLKANLSKVLDDDDIKINITIRSFVYIVSSLILLSAIIGFLRMQIQLFRMRSREVALRIVNGATSKKLFGLLVTEVLLFLCMSIIVAMVLAILLQNFLDTGLKSVIDIPIGNILIYSLIVGMCLLFLCCVIIWLTILYIIHSRKGLAENMRKSRNHLFRNVMLGIQIAISIVFVCGSFILANGADKVLEAFNVPDNDDFYKKCLYLRPYRAEQPERLIDEIERLPALDKMMMYRNIWFPIREIEECPEYLEKYNNNTNLDVYQTNDTAMPSMLGMDVVWFNRDVDRNRCMLLSEEIYNRFKEFGFLEKNTLTVGMGKDEGVTLPIAGIIKKIPYIKLQD
ncbi:MAG: ABC transporter permease, partial [Muribaculaceae bacterium]|nr:ABC transporter permease [Muribaculaceae bacterium]